MKKMKLSKENACILVLAGILCLVVVWPTSGSAGTQENTPILTENTTSKGTTGTDLEDAELNMYIENQEERLKAILNQVDGVGDVWVMIRASASKAYVVEKDMTTSNSQVLETDAEGGTRKNVDASRSEASIYTKDSNGNDVPLVVQEIEPEIEGVLVAAQGGDNEQVKSEITQAVQVLFDIPVHKIKVVKMKGK